MTRPGLPLLVVLLTAACTPPLTHGTSTPLRQETLRVTGWDYGPVDKFAAYLKISETTRLESVYVLFSDDRLCFVSPETSARVRLGDLFPCNWRFARRR